MFLPPEEPPEEVRELMARSDETLLEALHAVGIYVDNRQVQAVTGEEEGPLDPVLILSGHLGQVAFSDRVQRPQVEADRDVTEEIADATVAEEYERKRRKLLGLEED